MTTKTKTKTTTETKTKTKTKTNYGMFLGALSPDAKEWLNTTTDEKVLKARESYKREALKIDPATAEAKLEVVSLFDPYGLCRDIPGDLEEFVREEFFLRDPKGTAWIWLGDLPATAAKKFFETHCACCGEFLE